MEITAYTRSLRISSSSFLRELSATFFSTSDARRRSSRRLISRVASSTDFALK